MHIIIVDMWLAVCQIGSFNGIKDVNHQKLRRSYIFLDSKTQIDNHVHLNLYQRDPYINLYCTIIEI